VTASERDNLMAELSAYLDGELDSQTSAAVERLLAESAEARRTLEELRAVSRALRELPVQSAPRPLADSVLADIRRAAGRVGPASPAGAARGSAATPPPQRTLRTLRIATRLFAVAATLALAAVGVRWFALMQGGGSSGRISHTGALERELAGTAEKQPAAPGTAARETDGGFAPRAARGERDTSLGQELPDGVSGDATGPTGAFEIGRRADEFAQAPEAAARLGTDVTVLASGEIVGGATPAPSADEPAVALGLPAEVVSLGAGAEPRMALRVVIETDSNEEYAAALDAVARWRTAALGPDGRGGDAGPESGAAPAPSAGGERARGLFADRDEAATRDKMTSQARVAGHEATLRVPSAQVLPLLSQLEREAPGRTSVTLGGVEARRRIDTDASDEGLRFDARFAGGGGGVGQDREASAADPERRGASKAPVERGAPDQAPARPNSAGRAGAGAEDDRAGRTAGRADDAAREPSGGAKQVAGQPRELAAKGEQSAGRPRDRETLERKAASADAQRGKERAAQETRTPATQPGAIASQPSSAADSAAVTSALEESGLKKISDEIVGGAWKELSAHAVHIRESFMTMIADWTAALEQTPADGGPAGEWLLHITVLPPTAEGAAPEATSRPAR